MAPRTAPADFVAELQRRFGADYDVRWNETLGRWEVLGPTPDGRIVAQTWGWYTRRHPVTGVVERVPPDANGMPPYRDLDAAAQAEIIRNMERSFVGHSTNGGTVRRRFERHVRGTRDFLKARRRQRAETFTDLLLDAGTVRPSTLWKPHHRPAKALHVDLAPRAAPRAAPPIVERTTPSHAVPSPLTLE